MTDNTQRIALITDSTSDLPAELTDKYNIHVVPLHVIWGSDDLLDGQDITPQGFYERIVKDPIHPKTAQPTPLEFKKALEQAAEEGAEEAVVITISKDMSGTLTSVLNAKEEVSLKVHTKDSRSTTMGLGWQVLAAARAREAGADAEGMIAAAEKARQRMQLRFSVDTLDYLHKGGRIGGAQHLIGTALNLKPELYVDHEKGEVQSGSRTRTRSRAIDRMYANFFEEVGKKRPLHVAVIHTMSDEEANALAERTRKEHKPDELLIVPIGPVVGVHVGPGALGLAGYIGENHT
ncbi:MAG: DegV family protein [Chloroflexi bacterium]|nr:DegV family protein [Chloroflexota bacterium]